ncbi:MAG: ATP-dependent sacrificial sulfur transferase LarE [Methanomicrobiales archaeon]|nr:ATP-dependent sacrificial sulfur transferase LarE [Methanomicrobiales archaeon]
MTSPGTSSKREALTRYIADCGSLLIAYSGGVDSGLLATLAQEVLGDRVHCVLIDSPLVSRSAVRDAEQIAAALGLSFEIIAVPALDDTVCRNPPDRCYHCKKSDARILKRRAEELGLACIADGANRSDLGEHRPGLRASTEEGIVHPYIKAGITKADIRAIARERGLEFWDKPSAACLASRVPYGEEITDEKLRMIETAEAVLHEAGFLQARVRCHAGIARIEVIPDEIPRLIAMRDVIVPVLKRTGFSYITLDLEGYRSGSMDEVLPS